MTQGRVGLSQAMTVRGDAGGSSSWHGLSLAELNSAVIGSGLPVPFDTLYEDTDSIRSASTYDFGLGTIPVGAAGVVPTGMAGKWRIGASLTISLSSDDNPANHQLLVNDTTSTAMPGVSLWWQASWYTGITGDDSLPSQLLLNIVPRVVTLAEGDVVWTFASTGAGNGQIAPAPYDTTLLMEFLGT